MYISLSFSLSLLSEGSLGGAVGGKVGEGDGSRGSLSFSTGSVASNVTSYAYKYMLSKDWCAL